MPIELWQGLLIPFAGTTLGAACVFFLRNNLGEMVQRALTGFAAGVMVAASIWSLLLPAMEQAADMGRWSFVPAVAGFWLGILFLLGLDRLIPHLHRGSAEAEGIKSSLGKTTMLTLAVALHNIPEGMAVGAVYAGWLYGDSGIALTGALALWEQQLRHRALAQRLSCVPGQRGRLAGDLSCTAARRDLLRLLLCAGTKPPHGLANPQAVCAKGLVHPAL